MSVRRLAAKELQPATFAFSPDNADWAGREIAKYPEGRQASAVIPLLWKAQEQNGGWVSEAAIRHVAEILRMPYIRVLEVATFYTMFALEPVGKHFVQLCGTTPCMLRGANDLKKVCEDRIGPQKTLSADGNFSWLEVECLGACCNAPMVQINNDYYEDLTPETFAALLDDLRAGKAVKPGPQNGRRASEPEGAINTLTDPALFDGSLVGAWKKRFEEEEAKARAAAAEAERAKAADAAAAAADPEPAKPKETRTEQRVAETPADRVAAGKPATSPAAAAAAASGATSEAAATSRAKATPGNAPAGPPVSDEHKPDLLTAPSDGKGDDLELIWGVGPKLAKMLNGLGVFHYAQIAGWNEMNLRWVDQHLGQFKGRAVRDKWIEQAKKLETGWRPKDGVGDKFEG